jgi:hypothetical protein
MTMGGLIWFIILGVIIYRVVKNSNGTQQQAQKTRQDAMRMMQQNGARPMPPQNTYTAPNNGSQKRVMTDADRAKLEAYRKQKASAATPDIVSRAKANSAKYAKDETLQELEREHKHSEHVAPAGAKHQTAEETRHAHTRPEESHNMNEPEESLLGTIEDLMVKGYDGNLSFERDFIGEATDMINSFMV